MLRKTSSTKEMHSQQPTPSYTVLTNENKLTSGLAFINEINAGSLVLRAMDIAKGTELYPANPDDPANPRTWPIQPVQPPHGPINNVENREADRRIQDIYRSDRQHWQFITKQLKDDRDSWDSRNAAGIGHIISRLSADLLRSFQPIITTNNLSRLYQHVLDFVDTRTESGIKNLENEYSAFQQEEGQLVGTYLCHRQGIEAILTEAGRPVSAPIARTKFLNILLPVFAAIVATIRATQPAPNMDQILKILEEEESAVNSRAKRDAEAARKDQRIAQLEAQLKAMQRGHHAPNESILAATASTPTTTGSKMGQQVCTKCGKSGHVINDCYQGVHCPHCQGYGHPPSKCFHVVPCPLCNKTGHSKHRCPKKPKTMKTGGTAMMIVAAEGEEQFGFFD